MTDLAMRHQTTLMQQFSLHGCSEGRSDEQTMGHASRRRVSLYCGLRPEG